MSEGGFVQKLKDDEAVKMFFSLDFFEPFNKKEKLELANFDNIEISHTATSALNRSVSPEEIEYLRKHGAGLAQLGIDKGKAKFVMKLFDVLFEKYENTHDERIFDRPIFKVIDRIVEIAGLNHPSVDTQIEIENMKIIEGMLGQGRGSGGSN